VKSRTGAATLRRSASSSPSSKAKPLERVRAASSVNARRSLIVRGVNGFISYEAR